MVHRNMTEEQESNPERKRVTTTLSNNTGATATSSASTATSGDEITTGVLEGATANSDFPINNVKDDDSGGDGGINVASKEEECGKSISQDSCGVEDHDDCNHTDNAHKEDEDSEELGDETAADRSLDKQDHNNGKNLAGKITSVQNPHQNPKAGGAGRPSVDPDAINTITSDINTATAPNTCPSTTTRTHINSYSNNNNSNNRRRLHISQMAKDPLNIGVPMPVLVPVSVPSETATTNSFDGIDSHEESKKEVQERSNNRREGRSTTSSSDFDQRSQRVQDFQNELQHVKGVVAESSSDLKTAYIRRYQGISRIRNKNMGGHEEDDSGFVDLEECSFQLPEEDFTLPGGYAIGGPGLDESGQTTMITSTTGEMDGGLQHDHASSEMMVAGNNTSDILVEATLVAEESREEAVEERKSSTSSISNREPQHGEIQVTEIAEAKPMRRGVSKPAIMGVIFLFLVLVIIGVVLIVKLGSGDTDNDDHFLAEDNGETNGDHTHDGHTHDNDQRPSKIILEEPILQRVRKRGVLHCGFLEDLSQFLSTAYEISDQAPPSNSTHDVTTHYCSAIAAAAMGNASAFEIISVPEANSFVALATGEVDYIVTRTSMNMAQDVFEESIGSGVAYGVPYIYAGVGFTGDPFFVECGDNNIDTLGACNGLKICVHQDLLFLEELLLRVPKSQVLVANATIDPFLNFLSGSCNVMVTEHPTATEMILTRIFQYAGEVAVGKREYTSEMWTLTSLDEDQEWADFLKAVTFALLAAEDAGITQATAEIMGETYLFGKELKNMFIDAVGAYGNGDVVFYTGMPQDDRYLFNDGTTGLLASPPFGNIEMHGTGHGDDHASTEPMKDGTIERILSRGELNCGVRGGRPGFAQYNETLSRWEGMDVDMCEALAGGLFHAQHNKVTYYNITDQSDDPTGFVVLQGGIIDVFAGAQWTLENDIKEPTSGVGFSFTQPYFYGPVNETERFDENLCVATRQNDPQWSAFVYWTTMSVVHAEEHGINQSDANDMPVVHVFGSDLHRMFRDAIHCVGNYAEIYERNLSNILPRSGRNTLNLKAKGRGPLRYLPPDMRFSKA